MAKNEKKQEKAEEEKLQKSILNFLQQKQKWVTSSDFAKAIPEIKSRTLARRLLKEMETEGKVQIRDNPKRKGGYIFGLPERKKQTNAQP